MFMSRLFFLLLLVAPCVVAQQPPAESLDARLLRVVYSQDYVGTRTLFHSVDRTAPGFFRATVPLAFAGTLVFDGTPRDFRPAYRLALTQVSATGVIYAAKYTARRQRPYAVVDGIVSRESPGAGSRSDLSFPSGHAGLAFALATSASLSFPEWYVIGPTMLWATAVGVARPWMGVHYPSDVLAGALIGAGTAVLVHIARDALTPSFLIPDGPEMEAVFVPLVVLNW
jgi:membrane-associated phospholipid phosphatase